MRIPKYQIDTLAKSQSASTVVPKCQIGTLGMNLSGEIWIIETKGGFDRSGNSQDIDIYTPKKFEVLKAYLDAHGLKGGIVRNDATTDELCICMEHYSDDIGSDDWVLLENIFE